MVKTSGAVFFIIEINGLRAALLIGIEAVDKILNLRSFNENLTVVSTGSSLCTVSVGAKR